VSDAERERILKVYAGYDADPTQRAKRDGANPGLRYIREERRRVFGNALAAEGLLPLADAVVLDVGCGSGLELHDLRELGAVDANLHGVDLLPDRVAKARLAYPGMSFYEADGRSLQFADDTFDLVMANVVFSSILDHEIARALAAEMIRVTKPRGRIVIYDNRYPSPNRNVRAYGKRRIRALFPGCALRFVTLTPLPPLARWLGQRMPAALCTLAVVPQLKARYLAVVRPDVPGSVHRG
jgi:SAM-dependent methyltransferase